MCGTLRDCSCQRELKISIYGLLTSGIITWSCSFSCPWKRFLTINSFPAYILYIYSLNKNMYTSKETPSCISKVWFRQENADQGLWYSLISVVCPKPTNPTLKIISNSPDHVFIINHEFGKCTNIFTKLTSYRLSIKQYYRIEHLQIGFPPCYG